ncbi:tol-pal system YbgF family protein [Sporosarcina sp. P33]|uniref:tetratricopeptide repeat protein n=1 Tax=Sporosarcina sp. P33 TaxID=1930764 RepID=UPI0009BF3FFB|nr:hypothetical protein [Sporosarcina sp. P33]ARD48886.1 hypothetical protein SporoP33_12050 [Sporosarcina sp. P33]
MSSFTNIPMLVQQMQKEIRQKRYSHALDTIRELEKMGVSQKQILWHKAVLESKVGNLHAALAYLKELDSKEPHVAKLEEMILGNWDTYTQVVAEYNRAVSEIQLGYAENALHILDYAIHLAGKLPIPIELYRMKTILLARYHAGTLARFTAGLPMYALDDSTIKRVVAAEPPRPDIARPVPKPKRKRKLKKNAVAGLIAIAGVLLVSIVMLLANMIGQQQTANEPPAAAPAEKPIAAADKPAKKPKAKPEEEEELPYVTEEAAKTYYNEGYKQFLNENFPAAIIYLKYAVQTEESDYFTDDASYFLASSYLRERDYQKVVDIARAFLKEDNPNYKESPYREGIRLQESRALMQLDEHDDAIAILQELVNKPNKDWVTYEAKAMLKTAEEEAR